MKLFPYRLQILFYLNSFLILINLNSCGEVKRDQALEEKYEQQIVCGVPPKVMERDTQIWHSFEEDADFKVQPQFLSGYWSKEHVHDENQKWENKTQLKVYFLEEPRLPKWVIDSTLKIAKEWSKYSQIDFLKSETPYGSDIRVSFRTMGIGYYSLIGNVANRNEYKNEVTLWLENLDQKSPEEFRRTVLHEFGHALGLLHELYNPNNPILWDTLKTVRYFDSLYHWGKPMVYKQLFEIPLSAVFTQFDSNSIMIYPIPAKITKNNKSIAWPKGISKMDGIELKNMYSKPLN